MIELKQRIFFQIFKSISFEKVGIKSFLDMKYNFDTSIMDLLKKQKTIENERALKWLRICKTWVLNNSKVYSFHQAPPIYYFLYAYVCPFQIRTHTLTASNAFYGDEKETIQMEKITPNDDIFCFN